MWLVCCAVDTEFDVDKGLGKSLTKKGKCSSGALRGAGPDELAKYLGCKKGMVNYFSTVNDVDKKVVVLMDKRLMEAKWASFHPMDNHASTCISPEGILKIKELSERDDTNFEVVDFSALGPAPNEKPANTGKAKPSGQGKIDSTGK